MALTSSRTAHAFALDSLQDWSKEVGLLVHVAEARDLLSKDMFGKSNPFVVLKLWGQERVSHVIKNSLCPKWNQTFQFSMYNEKVMDDELTVTLWDKDNLFKNGFLGMVKIDIGSLVDNQARDLWYPLEKRSSKSRVKGNIRLCTQLTPARARDASIPFHSPFNMPSISATLDGASLIPYSQQEQLSPSLSKTTSTYSHFRPPPIVTSTLDESDFLHIESTTKEDKGKGKCKDIEWCLRSPSSPPCFPPPSPSHPSPRNNSTVYYDAFGDPVEDADMIAILKMEEEEKRVKEAEEDRLLREYLSTLQRCSVCGADDGGDPLSLPCDHIFCRSCLASHIRNIKDKKYGGQGETGVASITCPTCDGVVPEWAIKRALPTVEHEALLNQSLQSFIDSGYDIFRCPNPTCGAPIERVPHKHKLTQGPPNDAGSANGVAPTTATFAVEQHREEYRFRCRFCSTEFCSGCAVIPYHVGFTCEGHACYLKAKHCRFCAVTLDAANSGGSSTAAEDVCSSEECLEKSKLSCKKWNSCGHPCCGILDEQQCLPCLQCQDNLAEQGAEDFCNICWVESLGSAPSIKLKCGHLFHFTCIKSKIKKRWPAARITFGFSECPLCKTTIEHPALEEDLKAIKELKVVVQQKASQRLEFEGLSKAKEVVDPSSKFFNNRERYAMDRYAYFMCAKCSQPYFAGQRRCDAGEEDKAFDPADLICGACSGSTLAAECAVHGKDFLEWKCQFCCTISSWYCWGKTHFCNDCHTRQQKGDYLTKKPKSAIPTCSGPDKCPLGIAHPHCEEFLLGCSLCRNVHTF